VPAVNTPPLAAGLAGALTETTTTTKTMTTLEQTKPLAPCTITVNSTDPDILRFVELFTAGINSWMEAGHLIAQRTQRDPEFFDTFERECPDIPVEVLRRFEQIGQRLIYPNLLVLDCAAAKRLIKLPYALQEKHYKEPVEVLVHADGKWETLLIDIRNLAPDQARQVFSSDGIRSPGAQRAYIESAATGKHSPADDSLPYRVSGKKVHFNKGTVLTAKQLTHILSQMDV